jgi:hypothetical protein
MTVSPPVAIFVGGNFALIGLPVWEKNDIVWKMAILGRCPAGLSD